jgi:hypothetical protein
VGDRDSEEQNKVAPTWDGSAMSGPVIGRVGVETEYRGDVMVVLCVAFTSGEVQHQGKCIGHSPALAYPCILHDRFGGEKREASVLPQKTDE